MSLFKRTGLSLAAKLLLFTMVTLFGCVMLLSLASIWYQQDHLQEKLALNGARIGDTIRLGVRYAMMLNDREELAHIVQNLGNSDDIEALRIFNKDGEIMFSASPEEVGSHTNIRQEACAGCHSVEPPIIHLNLRERTRLFSGHDGRQMLGVLTPIMNEPSCSGPPCHFHPAEKQVLGALEVVLPLTASEDDVRNFQWIIFSFASLVMVGGGASVHYYLKKFLTNPVQDLIKGTRAVALGESPNLESIHQNDEIGELANSITVMSRRISHARNDLHRQRDEYQRLFDQVPCAITVQDKNFRLLRYNRLFRERFSPIPGDYCYSAYKGRLEKCLHCSVEQTMLTGKAHSSEESTLAPDGTRIHWLVYTSPVFDEQGQAVAVMEMSQDITALKQLEERLRQSEQKYQAIFNNIPSAVFMLDQSTLEILDCNTTAEHMYGVQRTDLTSKSFLEFFMGEDRERYASQLKAFTLLHRARHQARDGRIFHVDILLSPSEYQGKAVLLLIANDISGQLDAEQKVIHAGKMAMLGEMATGVAHELNQPLTVIKTASGFLLRKVSNSEAVAPDILASLVKEVDAHVDRATQIINHMRDFGRRTDLVLERVYVNEVIERACQFFNRQLANHNISLHRELAKSLPPVMAEPNRLEQVLINLLLNARDAVEERAEKDAGAPRHITIHTSCARSTVSIRVMDTGQGIPPALLARLFEPFFTTKKAGRGTGLGLSISYGLIKDFGGNIQAWNKPDDDPEAPGAIFTISLPCTTEGK